MINTWSVLERPEKKRFAFLVIADIFISLMDILSLVLLLWIVQYYIQPESGRSLPFLPEGTPSGVFVVIFFILFTLKNLLGYFLSRAHFRFIGKVAIRISRNNLVFFQQASLEDFIKIDSSVHIRRICYQPFEFAQYMLSGTQQIITQVFLISCTVLAILLFNAKLFLLLLIILLPPVIAVFYFIKKRLSIAKKHIQSSNEKSFQHVMDALKGYVESNIYDRHEFFLSRFIRARRQFSKYLFDSLALQTLPSRIIEIFAVLGLFALIILAKWSGHEDHASLLTIGAFLAAAYKIIPGMVKIINVAGQMKAYEFSRQELQPVLNHENGQVKKPELPAIRSIELDQVSFHFDGKSILKDLSINLRQGDFVGICGKSGIGKTTLFNILLGFLGPCKGEVRIDGIHAGPLDLKKYWPAISYVRQQNFLIHDSILRNITLEEENYDAGRLKQALELSGLQDWIPHFPEGMGKLISENGKNISGGQQQRIALARALYKNAEIFLLDEPFSELDQASTRMLLEHFSLLSRKGKLILMITHDKQSLSYCNKTYSLDEQD